MIRSMKQSTQNELLQFKEALLATGLFRHMNSYEYTCQCPFCKDNRQHCYVKIDTASDSPVVFWCHICTEHGIVGKRFLEGLNLQDDIKLPRYFGSKPLDDNKGVSIKVVGDLVTEKHDTSKVREYIEGRVGHYPTLEELKMFQYVGDPRKYALDYLGYNGMGRPFMNRHWFKLTNGKINGRWKDDSGKPRWFQFKTERVKSAGLYAMKKSFNPYEDITVVIAEGIMDVIGLYYNGGIDNGIFIAVLGKGYERGIKHILGKGVFGNSVNVRIYRDPNVEDNEVVVNPMLMSMFKSVELYHNAFGKDYGIKPEELDIHKSLNWKGGGFNVVDRHFKR